MRFTSLALHSALASVLLYIGESRVLTVYVLVMTASAIGTW